MDRSDLINEARKIVEDPEVNLKGKATQLQNLRELVRKGAPLEEVILYIQYQKARGQIPNKMAGKLVRYLTDQKDYFKANPEDLKYFIGNLVRAGMIRAR